MKEDDLMDYIETVGVQIESETDSECNWGCVQSFGCHFSRNKIIVRVKLGLE